MEHGRDLECMDAAPRSGYVLAHASSPSRQLGLWHWQDLPGLQRSQPRISLGTKAPSLRIPCLQLPPPVDQRGLAPWSRGHSRGGSGCGWFAPAANRTGLLALFRQWTHGFLLCPQKTCARLSLANLATKRAQRVAHMRTSSN